MDSINFEDFNSPADGVELTDTFDTWRKKTNGIIQKVDSVEDRIDNGDVGIGTITSNKLANNSVTTLAITNGSVAPEKLSSGGISWSSIETKIGPSVTGSYYVSLTPSRTGDGETRIRIGAQTNTLNNATIVRDSGENGNLVFTNNGTGNITLSAAGGVTFGSANMPTPPGSAPIYGVRAYAKVSSAGTAANNKGFSSISKTGTGVYNLILSVSPAEDPIVVATCHTPSGNAYNYSAAVQFNSSSNFTVKTGFEDVASLSDISFSIMVIY